MSDAGDVAAVIVASVATGAAILVLWATAALGRQVRQLRQAVDHLNEQAVPLLAEMQQVIRTADGQLARVDGLLGAAEEVSATADEAARVAYEAFSRPVIKALAIGTGTGEAARRFRRLRKGLDTRSAPRQAQSAPRQAPNP